RSLHRLERRRVARAIPLDPSAAAISRRLRAELWLDMEREPIERIVAELRSALAVQDAAGAGAAAATTRVTLARAETTRGRLQTARAALERAVDEFERQRAKVPDPVRRATFLAEHRRAAEDLIGTLWRLHRRAPDAGHAVQAFAVAERAKARSLLDRLASLDETPPGDDSPASTERRALLDRLAELSFRERRHGEDVARAVDDARSRLRVLDAERLEQRFGVAVSEPPAEADEVRAWLDPQTAGLGVFWGERSAYAWVLTDDDLTMFELPAPDRLAGRTAAARLAWSRLTVGGEESGDVHQAAENLAAKGVAAADDVQMDRAAEAPVATDPAAELAAALLQPARAQLADRERWIVAADGPLAALPFAALPLPWRGGKSTSDPVVLRHEVVQLPSLSVIRALRRRAADAGHGGGEIVVVADPPATSALPASRLEAQAVAEAVRAAGSVVPTRLVVGTDASRQRVLDGLFESADVVHLAVHGVVDPDQPERTALRLAQRDAVGRPIDGDLRLADIHRLRLRADLVVLSGCRTALGREIRGEGHLGLSHAFLAAGAERVVASLWPVADAATAELMRRFYRELLGGGVAPSTALRRAQVSLRAETRWRHPVYWAGFVVSGDWRS
ncbi:MAG: CHAT domain-containing protein, partial [Acidobacteriota bacterium]